MTMTHTIDAQASNAIKPDLTSVRSLIRSVTPLARSLGLTPSGVYRWIKVNRIPGAHIVGVANFYDVELRDLIPLTGSEKANANPVISKPKNTLATLIEVYRGNKTLAEACDELTLPMRSLKLIMTHWGDELPTLYTTLTQLDEKRISLETAMQRLNVTKYTLHGIRNKYGFAPGRRQPRPRPASDAPLQREAALQVIAGKMTTQEAMVVTNSSYRSIFRYIERLSKYKLNDLSDWPMSFRAALAVEIDTESPHFTEKWLKFAQEHRLFLKKSPKRPQTPDNWRNLPLKRLLVGVLLGEETIEDIATSRGADVDILRGLFTSDLRTLDLTFDHVSGMSTDHQTALAELMLAVLGRKRNLPTLKEGAK